MDDWVKQMQDMVDNHRNGRSQHGRTKPSIYKVPPFIPKRNKEIYEPQVVSFGPYHHGKPQLAWMEAHKRRALVHCIGRSGLIVKQVFDFVEQMAQQLKDSYDSLDSKWRDNTERFVQLMMLDGCFMLELLSVHNDRAYYYYPNNDIVFSQHGFSNVMEFIKTDMLKLENQLPMSLLLNLKNFLEKAKGRRTRDLPLRLLDGYHGRLIFSQLSDQVIGECWHVLDGYRTGLTRNERGNPAPQSGSGNQGEGDYPMVGRFLHKLDLYCKRLLHYCEHLLQSLNQSPDQGVFQNDARPATELHQAGVRFKTSQSNSLKDITFKDGVLRLPRFTVSDDTETMLLNLVAFERCHSGVGCDIISFVAFMDHIIDNGQDIKLLRSNRIIENFIGSDEEAARLFNKMGKDLSFDQDSTLGQVHNEMMNYSNKRWNKWRANLIQTYFSNPWAIISVMAAFLLLSLTTVQTIFTIPN